LHNTNKDEEEGNITREERSRRRRYQEEGLTKREERSKGRREIKRE
jgi:hypothetical protein